MNPNSPTMNPLSKLQVPDIQYVFTDIDDTLTTHGKLLATSYEAMWKLQDQGIRVVPVTGRPAGWCEMIARFWPVEGVIGENGALIYSYRNRIMERTYAEPYNEIRSGQKRLLEFTESLLKEHSRAQLSSDQDFRISDVSVDFTEDIAPPLPMPEVRLIASKFEKFGANAKISSIHVNAWFGDFDKSSMVVTYLKKYAPDVIRDQSCVFIGDSPNDEPLFRLFDLSVGVQNIVAAMDNITHLPKFLTGKESGDGFVEMAEHILAQKE